MPAAQPDHGDLRGPQQHEAQPVLHVEALELHSLSGDRAEPDAVVGEHAVHVEHQQPDSLGHRGIDLHQDDRIGAWSRARDQRSRVRSISSPSRSSGHCVAASLDARAGSGWVSRKNPSAPATAAAARRWRNELPAATARATLPCPGCCTECVASKITGAPGGLAQPGEVPHVDDEVAVAEKRSALGDRDVVASATAHLLDRACHRLGGHPLPLLHVDRPAGATGRDQQIGLPAEKCGDLQARRPPRPPARPAPARGCR